MTWLALAYVSSLAESSGAAMWHLLPRGCVRETGDGTSPLFTKPVYRAATHFRDLVLRYEPNRFNWEEVARSPLALPERPPPATFCLAVTLPRNGWGGGGWGGGTLTQNSEGKPLWTLFPCTILFNGEMPLLNSKMSRPDREMIHFESAESKLTH